MSRSPAVPPPEPVPGGAPQTGRLEPVLQRLAAWQGGWPPRRPAAVRAVLLEAPGSLATGQEQADDLVDRGVDLLVLQADGAAEQGLLVLAALLDLEPVRAVGTVPAQDWVRQTVAVRDGLRVARPHRGEPAALLDAVGAGTVAGGAGLLAQAAVRRTPVLLDGSVAVAAAALCASRLAPGAPSWWLAGGAPPVPAAAAAHREMGLAPLLDLGLPGPAGASIALSVLLQACDLLG